MASDRERLIRIRPTSVEKNLVVSMSGLGPSEYADSSVAGALSLG